MAFYRTEWLEVDTDEFENEKNVTDCIDDVKVEIAALCRDCPKARKCMDNLDTPSEDEDYCLKAEEYIVFAEIIEALRPYRAAFKAAAVA